MKKKYKMSISGACLTPCEFKKGVFVNSMACVGCDCYRGVDETIETVYCSKSSGANLPPLRISNNKTIESFEVNDDIITFKGENIGYKVYDVANDEKITIRFSELINNTNKEEIKFDSIELLNFIDPQKYVYKDSVLDIEAVVQSDKTLKIAGVVNLKDTGFDAKNLNWIEVFYPCLISGDPSVYWNDIVKQGFIDFKTILQPWYMETVEDMKIKRALSVFEVCKQHYDENNNNSSNI